jgi:hypothetical protein
MCKLLLEQTLACSLYRITLISASFVCFMNDIVLHFTHSFRSPFCGMVTIADLAYSVAITVVVFAALIQIRLAPSSRDLEGLLKSSRISVLQ